MEKKVKSNVDLELYNGETIELEKEIEEDLFKRGRNSTCKIWIFGKKFPAFRAWRRSFFRACHRIYAPLLFALRRRTDRNTFRSCEQQRLGKHKAFADLVPVLGADRDSLHKRALSRLCRGKNRLAMFFMRGAYRLLLRCRLVSSKPRGSFYARLSLFFSCICAKLFSALRQV